MEGGDFDPRTAALRYAAEVTKIEAADPTADGAAAAAAINALACGLVYVGDQIAGRGGPFTVAAIKDALIETGLIRREEGDGGGE